MKETHRTAISRNKLSLPMREIQKYLKQSKRKYNKKKALDYGCGLGQDAQRCGYKMYDPLFFPRMPSGKFSIITCIYVLNVISGNSPTGKQIRQGVVDDVISKLDKGGIAFFAVRRDRDNFTSSQYNVKLDMEKLFEDHRMCIYVYRKD